MIACPDKVRTSRWLNLGALVVLILASSGCGPGYGEVWGFVKQEDRPLVYGTVSMLCSDGLLRSVLIEEDGSYHFPNIPVGPVRIAVESNDPEDDYQSKLKYQDNAEARAALWRPPAEMRKMWFPIASKYKAPEASELEYAVQRGLNEHDIILTLAPDPPARRVPAGVDSRPDGTGADK